MIRSLRQKARKGHILPAFDSTRVVEIFLCLVTGLWVIKCSCGLYERWGLKCRHIYSATGGMPNCFDATYRWWSVFELACFGKHIDKILRKKLWKAEKMSNKHTGALLPEGMTCFPDFPNDRELSHFEETLNRPVIVERGFWKSRRGTKMVEEAVKLADLCGDNELKRFGMSEMILTSQELISENDSDSDSDEEGQTLGECNVDVTVEALAVQHPDLLQTVGRAHLEGELTEDMVKAIAKNPARECKELLNGIQTLVNTKEKANHWWHILQYAVEDFMLLTRMEEAVTDSPGGIIGNPAKSSGKKTSNKRIKRFSEGKKRKR
jgi:hypothetical protein